MEYNKTDIENAINALSCPTKHIQCVHKSTTGMDFLHISDEYKAATELAITFLKTSLIEPQNTDLTSHSERDIVLNCISLMEHLYQQMLEYLDYLDVEYSDEEQPKFSMSYFTIVQTLLLARTSHSGGNSTRTKCHELGFDYSEHVTFEPNINEGE